LTWSLPETGGSGWPGDERGHSPLEEDELERY